MQVFLFFSLLTANNIYLQSVAHSLKSHGSFNFVRKINNFLRKIDKLKLKFASQTAVFRTKAINALSSYSV